MAAHGLKVMQTVDVAVKGLADLDKLVPVLQGLGKQHVPYGVLPAHYEVVGQALIATLTAGLGAEWTSKVAVPPDSAARGVGGGADETRRLSACGLHLWSPTCCR